MHVIYENIHKRVFHIYHRDTNLVDLNGYAVIEIAVAIIYCDQRTCYGRHPEECDYRCCEIHHAEGSAEHHECRRYQLVSDTIHQFNTGEDIEPFPTEWGLQQIFPRKYRSAAYKAAAALDHRIAAAQATAQPEATASHLPTPADLV